MKRQTCVQTLSNYSLSCSEIVKRATQHIDSKKCKLQAALIKHNFYLKSEKCFVICVVLFLVLLLLLIIKAIARRFFVKYLLFNQFQPSGQGRHQGWFQGGALVIPPQFSCLSRKAAGIFFHIFFWLLYHIQGLGVTHWKVIL